MGIWLTDRERQRRTAFYIVLTAVIASVATGATVYYVEMAYIRDAIADLRVNQTTIIADVTQEQLVTQIVSNVRSSIVHITSTKITQDIFFRPVPVEGTGTGFIITQDGYIATNSHVVSGATKVEVIAYDGTEYTAAVIGMDPMTDIAIVKIAAANLTPVTLGDSSKVVPGQFVIAIGNPYRLDNTVTLGVVSALNRTIDTQEGYSIDGVIQTDAAINPGNSGGPLINMQGQVIGINSAILSTTGGYQGIGFAIPINTLKTVYTELIDKGKVTRAWLGITGMDFSENLATAFKAPVSKGALIVTVVPDGPADGAGLRATVQKDGVITELGDVITELGGVEVTDMDSLMKQVQKMQSGQKTLVRFVRGGVWKQAPITLGERPEGM